MVSGEALRMALAWLAVDERDRWLDEKLGFWLPADGPLPQGAVPYLPAGLAEILATIDTLELGPDDELVDLGAGIGRVLILANLFRGVRGRGVELQPHLVTFARDRIAALGIEDVSVDEGDAVTWLSSTPAFERRTAVFAYAPFGGATLRAAIDQLARLRPAFVCTVDCELDEPWLVARPSPLPSLAIYELA